MKYFNVGKIVNTQGLQGEMRVLSVTDFAEERFKKGAELALFDEKDQFVQTVTIASHRKHKNFDIIKFKDMYHINAIEKRVAGYIDTKHRFLKCQLLRSSYSSTSGNFVFAASANSTAKKFCK